MFSTKEPGDWHLTQPVTLHVLENALGIALLVDQAQCEHFEAFSVFIFLMKLKFVEEYRTSIDGFLYAYLETNI